MSLNLLAGQATGSGQYLPGQPGGAGGPGGPPAPDVGAGWEIRVLAAPDFHTLLAVIPNKMLTGLQFVKQFQDTGSGTITLDMDDPWWGPGWSYVPVPSPAANDYFIIGTPAAPSPLAAGDTFSWTGQVGAVFTVTSVSAPFEGYVNVSFTPPVSGAMQGGVITCLNKAVLPNGQPPSYLLDYEHCWQVYQDGVPRFEFLGETITEQLVDPSEQRIVTITGPGTLATLGWAMVAPNGFPGVITYKMDALEDDFDEYDEAGDLVLDTDLWNASGPLDDISLNPEGTAQLVCTADATFLGSTAWDATNTLLSAQVTPASLITDVDEPGQGMDGSQVTQMFVRSLKNANNYIGIGLTSTTFYAFFSGPEGYFTKVLGSAADYTTVQGNTGNYDYWQISESLGNGGAEGPGTFYIWTAPDGQNWTKQATFAHSWDATSCGIYFSGKYDAANTAIVTVTALNSNVVTSSLGGPSYYGAPIIGGVWLAQLQAAQARGTVPFVQVGELSARTDSFLNPWNDTNNVQLTNGTDLLTLLQGQASMVNASYIMQPGFRLQIGIPEPNQITLGTDRSQQVIFREGVDAATKGRTRARNQIANLLGVINQDGRTVTASDTTSSGEYGQREAWLQAATQVTQADLDVVASAGVQENADEVLSYTLTITPYLPGRSVFTGFDVGDWVGLERPDFSAVDKVQVTAIAVQVAADGSETHELTLVTYVAWLQEQLTWIATKLGGGYVSANGTTAIAGNGSLTAEEPTVFSISFDGLGGVGAGGPSGGTPLVYDPVTGQWLGAGTVNPDTTEAVSLVVSGSAGQVTIAGDGSSVSVGTPAPTPADVATSTPVSSPAVVVGVTQTTVTDADGTVRVVVGAQDDGTYTSQDYNGPAPGTPDAPAVTPMFNGLLVAWDGNLNGASPLSDFLWTEVHVSTVSGFSPSPATLQGTMITASILPVAGLTIGTAYYVRLMARNSSGIAGIPSAQAEGTPTSLTASLIGQLGVLNANPYFSGGDPSTWQGFYGNFSVTSSPPSGSPTPYAGYFVISTAGEGAAAQEAGQPFRVSGGTPYLVTGWVNTPTTSAVIGLAWQNSASNPVSTSTEAFAVSPNTWTLVTAVFISPSTAAWAFPQVSPLDGYGNSIYFEAVLCLPQVPGALIQAGTITATQIAANTITASQIAAGTITAAQLAANTITAAQIAAGVVVAGIVDGTIITGAQLVADGDGGQILVYGGDAEAGDLVGSWSSVEAVDQYGNAIPPALQLTGPDGSSMSLIPAANEQITLTSLLSGIYQTVLQQSTSDPNQLVPSHHSSVLLNQGAAAQQMASLWHSPNQGTGSGIMMLAQSDDTTVPPSILLCQVSSNDDVDLLTPIAAFTPYAMLLYSGASGQVVVTKTSGSGTITVPATIVGNAKAECWGGGGGGGTAANFGAAGAGGGEYACEPEWPVPGAGGTIHYAIGSGGAGGGDSGSTAGGNTTLSMTGLVTVTAHGGVNGQSTATPGAGGSGSANTVHYNGGGGGSTTGGYGNGGGGGSSGGTGQAGIPGTPGRQFANGQGYGVVGGGTGGDGGHSGDNGSNGLVPGGGGGGSGAGANGGNGGNGQIRVTYSTGVPAIMASFASAAGTDGFGTPYPAGTVLAGADSGWKKVGAAGQPAFAADWANNGGSPQSLGFRNLGQNIVMIDGIVKPSSGAGATLFTLPAAYTPASTQYIMGIDVSDESVAIWEIQNGGPVSLVTPATAGHALSINGTYSLV